MIVSAEKGFWENSIVKKVSPPLDGSSAAEKYVKERYKDSDSGISVNLKSEYKDKIKNYFELKNTIKELEVQAKEIENNVKLELGEAEIGYTPDYEIDWKSITSNKFDSKKFKKDHPELFKQYLNTSSYRKFSIKEVKA